MEILLNPNFAYLLLSAGLFFTVLAMLSPGTGILEILGLVMLIAAGWSIYNLPINGWALLVILIGIVLFFLAIRRSKQMIYLAASIASLVVGSAFLFRSEEWYIPAVNPFLALAVSLFMGIFFWIVARKVLEAESVRPTHDLGALLGKEGVAKSEIHAEGSVQVSGELWTATSMEPIPEGANVRVVGRDGFMLQVEAVREEPE
jgi:membrane-bound serine protease (ClpP class)